MAARRLAIVQQVSPYLDRAANQIVIWLVQDGHTIPDVAVNFSAEVAVIVAEILAHLSDSELNAFLVEDKSKHDGDRVKRLEMVMAALGAGAVCLQTMFQEKRNFEASQGILDQEGKPL